MTHLPDGGDSLLRYPCGGRLYSLDELTQGADADEEQMWHSILGPFDLYCADEDETLTELEVLQAKGLMTPIHDELDQYSYDWPIYAD